MTTKFIATIMKTNYHLLSHCIICTLAHSHYHLLSQRIIHQLTRCHLLSHRIIHTLTLYLAIAYCTVPPQHSHTRKITHYHPLYCPTASYTPSHSISPSPTVLSHCIIHTHLPSPAVLSHLVIHTLAITYRTVPLHRPHNYSPSPTLLSHCIIHTLSHHRLPYCPPASSTHTKTQSLSHTALTLFIMHILIHSVTITY
jgi:hypothetical protein